MGEMRFPAGFVWGTATSAFQIEGATQADGRGESIWDRFAATAGNIVDGSDGREACGHYSRFRDDVALMQRLGIEAYRFSVAWPRVLPAGRGNVNHRGLDFYDALVDTLLDAGIEPFVTLYHWDLPQALEEKGGWPERSTAEAFVEYAAIVGRRLGDRVRNWITHNEPWCSSMLGYRDGTHAPGRRSWADGLAAAHHLLLSHGWAVQALRACATRTSVGITLNLAPAHPASSSEVDWLAARYSDGELNRWFLDPLYGHGYPQDVVETHAQLGRLPKGASPGKLPFVAPGDLNVIAVPTDFLGVNYYTRMLSGNGQAEASSLAAPKQRSSEVTDMGWEVYPVGLYELLMRVQRDYRPERLYVTENGAAYGTEPDSDGCVSDHRRLDYLRKHCLAAHAAINDGVPLAGYFVWSLLDNFEWSHGYTKRFGIVWVDYATQARTPKQSAHWYAQVIDRNAVV